MLNFMHAVVAQLKCSTRFAVLIFLSSDTALGQPGQMRKRMRIAYT